MIWTKTTTRPLAEEIRCLLHVCIDFSVFLILSSSNSTDAQQSPPTVEVTPPDSHPEGNGVVEEQSEGDGQPKISLCCSP